MIASAASAPPSAESAATAGSSAGEQLVQRQPRADHAGREDEHLLGVEVEQPRRLGRGRERVELAALAGGGVRDAGVDRRPPAARRARGARGRSARQAAWTRLRVNIAAPIAGGTERTTARSLRSRRRIPAATPEATKPLAAVTLTRAPRWRRRPAVSAAARARGSRSAPPARRRPCRGCRARRSTIARAGRPSAKTPISAASVPWTRAISGSTPSGSTRTTGAAGVGRLEQPRARRRPSGRNRSRAGRGGRQQVRHEADRRSRAPARSRARAGARRPRTARSSRARSPRASVSLERPAGARHARLRVDDDRRRRRRRAAARARAAPRSRSSRGSRSGGPSAGCSSGSAVAPRRPGVGAVPPLRHSASSREPVHAAEVDDDRAVAGGCERGRRSLPRQRKIDVGAARGRLGVRHEAPAARRSRPRVERRAPAGRRASPSRARPARARGGASTPVERLLAGVAGGSEDGDGLSCMMRIMHKR